MAAPHPRYGAHFAMGANIQSWLASPDGECPIKPCTLVIRDNDPQYRTVPDEAVTPMGREDIYCGTSSSSPFTDYSDNAPHSGGPYSNAWTHMDRCAQVFDMPVSVTPREHRNGEWIPYYRVEKWDPIEHTYKEGHERDTRMLALKRRYGDPLPADKKEEVAWDGFVNRRHVVIDYIVRNHDEPPLSEVTNAIYSKMFPDDDLSLREVFVHDIHNKDTYDFIKNKMFVHANNQVWPPAVGRQRVFAFDANTRPDEFKGLLGTKIGKVVGFWMLGRYPRGTCTISGIHLTISPHDSQRPVVDMLFQVKPTKPPHKLPEPAQPAEGAAGEAAGPAGGDSSPEEEEPITGEPAFLPSSPPSEPYSTELEAAGPDPPPVVGAVAVAPAIAPVIPPAAPPVKPLGPLLAAAAAAAAAAAVGPAAPVLKIVGPAAPVKPPGKPPAAVKKAKKDNLKRKAEQEEMQEADKRYGKTRSGKERKRG